MTIAFIHQCSIDLVGKVPRWQCSALIWIMPSKAGLAGKWRQTALIQINARSCAKSYFPQKRLLGVPMLNTILVPVDGSTHANAAVDFASSLSAKFGSKLILVNVITKPGSNRVPEDLRSYAELEKVEVTERDIAQAAATEIVNGAGKRALKQGAFKVETLTSVGDPAREIVALAKKRKADMVAMGRRGRGDLKGLLLGSVSHKVSQLTNCPCLTVM